MQFNSMRAPISLILSLLLLSAAQIIPSSDNSTSSLLPPISSSQSAQNLTFTDRSLNLSNLDSGTVDELNNCLSLLNDSNVFLFPCELVAAVERNYSDGYRQYYLYLDLNDTNGNIHQFQTIVSLNNGFPIYTLESIIDVSADSPLFDNNSSVAVTQPIVTQTVQTANSPSKLYDSIAQGFTQLSQKDIKADNGFSALEADLSRDYPMVSNAQQSAVYRKAIGLASSYISFYQTSKGDVFSLFGVVDNVKKVHYIISVNQVDTSSIKGK